jgi:hypothetical protein
MPAEPTLFPEEVEAIRTGLLAGENYMALARRLDRDRSTVIRCARRIGVRSQASRGRPTGVVDPDTIAVIRGRIMAGESFHKIAAAIGRDCKTISNIARRLGLRSAHKRFGA